MVDFYRLDVAAALQQLNSDPETGLTGAEVQKRQAEHGRNILPTGAGVNWFRLIAAQFADLMVMILIIAAVVSFFLGDTKDVIIILAIVVLNAILGAYQEMRAEQALAALSAMQVPQVRVRRGGEVRQISAEDLVPGDILVLGEGDRIPADGRLIEAVNLQVEEAALTGESQPVSKITTALPAGEVLAVADRVNMVYMGTSVNFGRGEMVVTETGLQTELGSIAAMLLQVEQTETPLQRRITRLGQILAAGAGVIVLFVFVAGLLRGIPAEEMFVTAISLAVAAVPEGLPAIITIGLSLGAGRMIKRNVLIRRLPAVETLGSVTVICSDKTGTLTRNEMTVTTIALPGHPAVDVSGIGYTPEGEFRENGTAVDAPQDLPLKRFIVAAALATDAYLEKTDDEGREGNFRVVGDTTEGALLVMAQKAGWTRDVLERGLPRRAELPFSSERKAMTTVHAIETDDARDLFPGLHYVSITKGAPDRLIGWSTHESMPDGPRELTAARREVWLQEVDKLAAKGLRVLGVAYRPLDRVPGEAAADLERELRLLGLVGILDPARAEAKEAVQMARRAGIRTIMITGDHALTAETIARDLGILDNGQEPVTGIQLDAMSEGEIERALETTSTFARVSPTHKLKLVKALQRQHHIVAMTGDGVNDAPALKQADIGVAMGITGTDVSKGAAEMVLVDDNYASIVAAVEEGRTIYDNIRKFIRFLLSSNVGEILVMFLALIIGLKIPLLAIQILWINLVTDGLPAIALGFEPAEEGVMKRQPRDPQESIFAGGMGRHIGWVAILLTVVTLTGYLYGYTSHGMAPFSGTLGLETFTQSELTDLVGDAHVPQNWDALPVEARRALLRGAEAREESAGLEGASAGLLGEAERIARTFAFTILALGQIFHVMAIHAGRASFFRVWFNHNRILLWAVLSTLALQLAVVYLPFLQATFETEALKARELLVTAALASVILFAVEIEKYVFRHR